jgi:hypothetical protein
MKFKRGRRFFPMLIGTVALVLILGALSNREATQNQFEQMLFISQIDVGSKKEAAGLVSSNTGQKINYLSMYPSFLDCKHDYTKWSPGEKPDAKSGKPFDYKSLNNSQKYHNLRITRAVSVYFPTDRVADYIHELKWFYRSWVHMQSFEPTKWRTDLVVFIDLSELALKKEAVEYLNDLNCKTTNERTSDFDLPRCVLVDYVPVKRRKIKPVNNSIVYNPEHFLTKVDIFSNQVDHFIAYDNYLIQNTATYPNLDSVLIAFNGYEYFSKAKYDFVMRTGKTIFILSY